MSSIVEASGETDDREDRTLSADAPVSNTENPFAEEHTEGFDIAPTGSGDLQEKSS